MLKGSVVFFLAMSISILGKPGDQYRTKSPRSFGQSRVQTGVDEVGTRGQIGQKPKNNMAASSVVKVLVSFYRSGEDSDFERHRSRVTFDLAKQSSVAAFKKHLTEFVGP